LVNHCAIPSIGQTWVLASIGSIGAVVEMGILSTLKQLLMESIRTPDFLRIAVLYHPMVSMEKDLQYIDP
jgi:hypothetical protein